MAVIREDRHLTCAWCGESFTVPSRRGPAPMYCRPSHRQAAHLARLRHAAGGSPRDPRADELAELRARVEAIEARLDGRPAQRGPGTKRTAGRAPAGSRKASAKGKGR